MGKVVSNYQDAFVKGAQILDAIFFHHKWGIDWRMESNISGIICKMDIEKGYDYINWEFLMGFLKMMGFD